MIWKASLLRVYGHFIAVIVLQKLHFWGSAGRVLGPPGRVLTLDLWPGRALADATGAVAVRS